MQITKLSELPTIHNKYKTRNMLLMVDCQNDFIEGGSLPVLGAQHAMDDLAQFITNNAYDYKVMTLDWHPYDHCSFQQNGGEWPNHCLQHSVGAAIYPHLLQTVLATNGQNIFLTKGNNETVEEYSIFANNTSKSNLAFLISAYHINQIDICGIAGDICVLNTLKDGIKLFGKEKFRVLQQFCPSIDGGTALNNFITTENINILT